jgi:hypothetical protein
MIRHPAPTASRRLAAQGLLACGLALAFGGVALAAPQQNPPAVFEGTQRGPWVPPSAAARASVQAAPTRGAALHAQAEARLRADFDAAAAAHGGQLTRAQAEAAGLGYVARHFDRIDRDGVGAVRFEDLQRFSRQRAAEMAR